MAKTKTPDAEAPGFAGADANAALEHTDGGVTTRDGMDAGVPMTPGQPGEPVGPEDAMGPGPKRGDYRDRLVTGPSLVTVPIPEEERRSMAADLVSGVDADQRDAAAAAALGDVPRTKLVPAADVAADIGDAPGKGGVSTEEARASRAAAVDEAGGGTPAA